jgi:RNA polymerase sigma-70 factor (ECF subfamily)
MAADLGSLSPVTEPRIAAPSDAHLVREMMEGSQDALASLYDRHGDLVFAVAMRTSRDRWIAAEVVQDTFLVLWNRAELYDPSRGALATWLSTIARNRATDRLRSAGRHERATTFSSFARSGDVDDRSTVEWLMTSGELLGVAGPEPAPEMALSSAQTRASIAAAFASLDPTERSVIELAYNAGLSQSEIANRLGWPIGTVKTRTRRALRHLREQLERADAGVRESDSATGMNTEPANHSPGAASSADRDGIIEWGSAVMPASFAPTAALCRC